MHIYYDSLKHIYYLPTLLTSAQYIFGLDIQCYSVKNTTNIYIFTCKQYIYLSYRLNITKAIEKLHYILELERIESYYS